MGERAPVSADLPHKAARCMLAALLSACAWVAYAQTGGEPVFTAPPGSGVRGEAEAAARPDPQELAHDAVALFRRVCVRVAGEPASAVDRALAAGLTPHVSEDSRDSRALLGGAPGQVYAPPGPAALLQVALADEGRCTVWVEQAEGPQVKEGFETVIDNLRSRGAKVRAVGERVVDVKGLQVLAARLDGADARALRETMDKLKGKLKSAAIVLATVDGGKVQLAAGVTADRMGALKAGELVNFVAQQVGGKGGGKPDLAMAGGTDPSKLDDALRSVAAWVSERL